MENTDEDADTIAIRALLAWYGDMGVDDVTGTSPADYYGWSTGAAQPSGVPASPPRPTRPARPREEPAPKPVFRPAPQSDTPSADEAIKAAEHAARACASFEALEAAVHAFDGCPLKAGASKTVFYDGVPAADLLVLGEAPGRDEDRIGKPFVGRAGQLLDRMLAAINRSRTENVLISNVIYWRPPGNRTPTPMETAVCRPFVERLIELTAPKAVVLAGGAPLQAMLGVTGIMRTRGVWREIETASDAKFPALPIFHPAFLLRQPANKRLAWADLQTLAARLSEN